MFLIEINHRPEEPYVHHVVRALGKDVTLASKDKITPCLGVG
jgi:hypothetical protein